MKVIGGYIVARANGGPFYGYCRTISVYDTQDRAAAAARALGTPGIRELFGDLTTRPVELRIRGEKEPEDESA